LSGEFKMSVNFDIEIREHTSSLSTFFKVVVFEVETKAGVETRFVRDIYHADSYSIAVNLLPDFLNNL